MVKFVPVTDVERPKAAQNLNASANDKHRRFDNPHSVGKTVDRGWQQGNVGWGVLGAFGNLDKDDAAQVIKRAEGVNKMVKNEKGLWVKVKSTHTDAVSATSSSRGRGGGISVLDSLGCNSNSSYDKQHSEDEGMTIESRRRSDDRFRDKSGERYQSKRSETVRNRSRSRSRSRSNSSSNYRNRCNRRRSRSTERRSRRSDHRRSDRHRRERHDRSSSRSRSKSSSVSRTRHRKSDGSRRDNDHRSHLPSGGRKRDRSSSSHTDRNRRRSNDRYNESNRDSDRNLKSERRPDESSSSSSGTDITEGTKTSRSNTEKDDESRDPPSPETEEEHVFEFSATQLANRFLEVFSGLGLNLTKRSNTEDEEEESGNRRLDAIADLLSENSQVLSLKSGKVMLSGKSSIRSSFTRTSPEESRCSHRVVLNIPQDTVSSDTYSISENAPKGSVSYCLDFHAPFTSPGLGDRTKDTALLYRCVGSLLTHIWGAVDPDKFSTAWSVKQSTSSKEAVLDTKCWAWATAMVSKEFPSFTDLVTDSEVVIFHDYNTIESWG